jgi:CheY-like chemotaxis protein
MLLNGWKEIASHLGRGVRTVQRWERLGLPVRRPNRRDRSAVCAFSEEVDQWLGSAPTREPSERATVPDTSRTGPFSARILIVDNDEKILVTAGAVLSREGYEIRTARDGFEALAVLRGDLPDLLISDLTMPNMSGFELLGIVRKRFPGISVIVWSAEFAPATSISVLADRYLQKGKASVAELKRSVRDLLAESPVRAQPAKPPGTPTWIPRSTNGYVVLTCLECLRPFSVPIAHIELDHAASEMCVNCGQQVPYLIDSHVAATDVSPSVITESRRRARDSRDALKKAHQASAEEED